MKIQDNQIAPLIPLIVLTPEDNVAVARSPIDPKEDREMLATASGQKMASEELGYGDNEFVPWQVGAVM